MPINKKEEVIQKEETPKKQEFDDYGLNDTINFINEYKRGLKKYNN